MKNKGIKVLLSLILVLTMVLGLTSVADAITNGQPDGNEHPYVCLVVLDVANSTGGHVPAWRTTGILLSPTIVLTAGHGTDGAVAARVYFDEVVEGNPDYPYGGASSYEGIPYTYEGFSYGENNGLAGYVSGDVGIIVLTEPVDSADIGVYGVLPEAGLVDTLRRKTDVDLVGYGVQEMSTGGGGPPSWDGDRIRLYAPAELLGSPKGLGEDRMLITANPGQGTGGTAPGDSGGPILLGGTDTVLGLTSVSPSRWATGISYDQRIDIPEIIDWIQTQIDEN